MTRRWLLFAIVLVAACSFEAVSFTPVDDDAPDGGTQEVCGDDRKQEQEDCDGTDLGDADCTTAGDFTGGTLSCTEMCAFDVSACVSVPSAPRLRMPPNGSHLGIAAAPSSLRVRFTWEHDPNAGDAGLEYELQYSTSPTFSAGITTITTSEREHRLDSPPLVSTSPPVGTRYYWRVRACTAKECSEFSTTWSVNLGRSPADFNGDGFADVAVGAPGTGRVYVYFGASGGGFDSTPDGTITGDAAAGFGHRVAHAGDLNGDGFGDLIIGAHLDDTEGINAGRAFVYFGGPGTTFNASPDGTLADGEAGDTFGKSVTGAGDLNGDGYADLAIGAYGFHPDGYSERGRAFVYLGGAGGTFEVEADAILTGNMDYLGVAVAGPGDVDGDGFADLLVSGYGESAPPACQCAHLFLGGTGASFDTTRDLTLVGEGGIFVDGYGEALAGAGDVNGDGFADILVGAPLSYGGGLEPVGRAYVYFGGGPTVDIVPDGVLTGAATGEKFGFSVAGGADMNGDGFDDVAVGAPGSAAGGSDSGRAYFFLGAASAALDPTHDGLMQGTAGEGAGSSVRIVGDLNGDGLADATVGAPGNAAGGANAGRAYVLMGATGGVVDTTPDGTLTGAASDRLGSAIARHHSSERSPAEPRR